MTATVPGCDVTNAELLGLLDEVLTVLFGERGLWPAATGTTGATGITGTTTGGDTVGAAVELTGGWDGQALVTVDRRLAAAFAEQVFALAPGGSSEADVRDVVAELANVVGGNLKSLLPGPTVLSLPHPCPDGQPAAPGGLDVGLTDGGPGVHVRLTPYRPTTGRTPS